MAIHKVTVTTPPQELERSDVAFVVSHDGKKLGELLISKGAINWKSSKKQYTKKLSWVKFDELFETLGKPKAEKGPVKKKTPTKKILTPFKQLAIDKK